MRIEIQINKECKEPLVVIHTEEVNEEVNRILQVLESRPVGKIVGFQQDIATILEPEDIMRIYTENQKVFCETEQGVFLLRLRLYEAENQLDSQRFVRISHSEIVNFSCIKNMDLSFTGTICMKLKNGNTCFVSRRYLGKIKNILGL